MQENQAARFSEKLEGLKELADFQGKTLSEEQVKSAFSDMNFDDSQLQMVYDYLKKERIGIGENILPEEYCTPEDMNYLAEYLEELKNLPTYTDGQKKAYLMAAMQQDKEGKQKVMEIFLPQIPEIAKIYAGQGIAMEDLIGEGNVALAVVTDMLESQTTSEDCEELIVQMVMRAMEEMIEQNRQGMDADEEMIHKMNLVLDTAKEIYDALLRKATMEEVAKETGLSVETIRAIDQFSNGAIAYMESEYADSTTKGETNAGK